MKYALLLIGLAVLLFGCVVQPAGPLEESVKPPAGLDVKEAFDDDSGSVMGPDMMENGSVSVNGTMMENGTLVDDEGMMGGGTMMEGIISSSELSAHNSPSDCWLLYDGDVYDVTDFLLQHPGGAGAITPYCGKDDDSFKQAFEGQHGMTKTDVLQSMPHMGSMMGGGMMGN